MSKQPFPLPAESDITLAAAIGTLEVVKPEPFHQQTNQEQV